MAFDVIGDIAILDETEKGQQKQAVESLRKTHPHLKTILMKTGGREGEFRTRPLKKLWGDGTETTHLEYGMRFRLDAAKCYFSPRELTERQRVAADVSPKETVMVMFGGVAPFAIAIARKQPKVAKVFSVELNPECLKYAEENIKLNQCRYVVEHITGDVREACKPHFGRCDRVVMPLPAEGHRFLPVALACLKPKGGVIHFYYVGLAASAANNDRSANMFKEAAEVAKAHCKRAGKKCRILGQHKVLPFGPGKVKVCIDLEIR
jgi:tRNA (guanine37-N1)-methyltransferase